MAASPRGIDHRRRATWTARLASPEKSRKNGRRAVAVVMAVEEYERLKSIESEQHAKAARSGR